jgi:amino acid transporter
MGPEKIAPPQPGLERVIGVRALAANAINLTVGAGIFALPALVAAQLGPSAFFAYVVCAIAMGLVLLCFAESGSRVHESGGACAYVEAAFGPFAGFLVSTLLWFGYAVVSIAAVAVVFVGTVATAVPFLGQPLPRAAFLILLFAGLAALNIWGMRQGARAVEIVTLIKLVPLLLLVAVGVFAIKAENLVIEELPSAGSFGAATLMLFFAFGGAETAVNPSGEIRNPGRTIPRGLLGGILAVVVLYIALQAVTQGVLGSELPNFREAPLAAAAGRIMGGPGVFLLLAAAAISTFGTLVGDLLASPRALYAAAREGALPKMLAAVHPRFHTPYISIALYAVFACTFAISGAFEQLAVLSSVAILLVYLSTAMATVQLRRKEVSASGPVFRLVGGYTIPLLAAVIIVWLLAQATRTEWIGVGLLLLVASALFFSRRSKISRSKEGVDE